MLLPEPLWECRRLGGRVLPPLLLPGFSQGAGNTSSRHQLPHAGCLGHPLPPLTPQPLGFSPPTGLAQHSFALPQLRPTSSWAWPTSETVGRGMVEVSLWLLQESFRISASAPRSPQNLDFSLEFLFFSPRSVLPTRWAQASVFLKDLSVFLTGSQNQDSHALETYSLLK